MKESPILFSAPMVRALLAGTKTQTRRIFKPDRMTWDANGRYTTYAMRGGELSTTGSGPFKPSSWLHYCPYGQPGGDRLYVRETFGHFERNENFAPGCEVFYRADGESLAVELWRPSIHMPRWASRITLEITGVRVERLQDISEEDAITEGIERADNFFGCTCWKAYGEPEGADVVCPDDPIGSFRTLWESTGGDWDANPWVWAIDFKVLSTTGRPA